MKKLHLLFLLPLLFATLSCNRESEPAPAAEVRLVVSMLMDGAPLATGSREYRNQAGNRFTVEQFRFFLSNVKLHNRTTGTVWEEPDSYHLVTRNPDSHLFEIRLKDVPPGTYDDLEFAVGVDPSRNYSLDQVGDLDPSSNMAWDWNTGYKFILLEGRFFPEGHPMRGLVIHIGTDENYRVIRLPLSTSSNRWAVKEGTSNPDLRLRAEVSAMFSKPNLIDFNERSTVMFGPLATKMADNYARNMFSLEQAN